MVRRPITFAVRRFGRADAGRGVAQEVVKSDSGRSPQPRKSAKALGARHLIGGRLSPSGFRTRFCRAKCDATEWRNRVEDRLSRVRVCDCRPAEGHEFPLHVGNWSRHSRIGIGEPWIRARVFLFGCTGETPTQSPRVTAHLDLSRMRRVGCRMENTTQGRTPDDHAAIKPEAAASSSMQTYRAAFEEQALAQRARNASAIVRAQQKVARERQMPGRQPK